MSQGQRGASVGESSAGGLPRPPEIERVPADLILDPKTVLLFLLAVIAILVLADAAIGAVPSILGRRSYTLSQLYLRFDLDSEGNLPSYFSALLLLLACAGLSAWIARDETRTNGRWAWHWWLVAAGFAYLSIDEAAELHELLNMPVRYVLETWQTHAAWTLVALVVLGLALLFLASFLRAMPARLRRMLAVAAAVYLGGAVGVEVAGGQLDKATLLYEVSVSLEEGLEMTGAALFAFALLTRLAEMRSTIVVRAEHVKAR